MFDNVPVLRKIMADIQVYIGMALMIGFSAYAVHTSSNSAARADKKAKEAQVAVTQIDQYLCQLAVPSWEVRKALIEDVNEPSKLSPMIDPNSEIGRTLQAQIDQANKARAERMARELKLNGPKPCQ